MEKLAFFCRCYGLGCFQFTGSLYASCRILGAKIRGMIIIKAISQIPRSCKNSCLIEKSSVEVLVALNDHVTFYAELIKLD